MNEVVVARYAENLDWIGEIPPSFDVVVYNKGKPIESAAVRKRAGRIMQLDNSGRESDTFLRHIRFKRDFSDGYTVFLQGDPFEHSPDILNLLGASARWEDVQPLSWRWLANEKRPPKSILDRETSAFIGQARVRAELFSLTTWNPLQFFDAGSRWLDDAYRRAHDLPEGLNIAAHFLQRCEWSALAEQAERHMAGRFSYGALFAVRQALLRDMPQRSLDLALQAANAHPTYGYVIERLWLHMCGEPFLQAVPAPSRFHENLLQLSPRFVPSEQASKPTFARRLFPAAKKRVLAWALS